MFRRGRSGSEVKGVFFLWFSFIVGLVFFSGSGCFRGVIFCVWLCLLE